MDAWIAALSALLGTGIGGLISYLTTRAGNKQAAALEARKAKRDHAQDLRRLASQFVRECASVVEAYDSNFKVRPPDDPNGDRSRIRVDGKPVISTPMIAAYWEVRLHIATPAAEAAMTLNGKMRGFSLPWTHFTPGVDVYIPDDDDWAQMHREQNEAAIAFVEAVRQEAQETFAGD